MKQPKDKKCAWSKCGKIFKPNPFRFNQRTCDNTVCAVGYVRQKEEEKEAREWRKKRSGMIENLKKLSDYENEAREPFQLFIRLRDKDLPCISCDRYDCPDWAGGHLYAAGQYSGLIFDEDNCHKQCNSYCNKYLHGNPLEYRKGLIKRYGSKFLERLDERAILNRKHEYTREELIEIRNYYRQKVKDLKDINNV